jgi:hypothetical protein
MAAGAIQRWLQSGKEPRGVSILTQREVVCMARMLVWVLFVVLLIGGAIWLSRIDAAKPLKHVEKTVPANALPR